jgi:hypothetical protein
MTHYDLTVRDSLSYCSMSRASFKMRRKSDGTAIQSFSAAPPPPDVAVEEDDAAVESGEPPKLFTWDRRRLRNSDASVSSQESTSEIEINV